MNAHDPIPSAESAVRARAEETTAAREALARAESAAATAAENVTRAKALAEPAAEELDAATDATTEAETAWTADQTPARWTKLSNAKGARDQAEVRARSLRVAADGAQADHAAATLRVAGARADLEAAEARHQRAVDVLEGFRASKTAADEESARVEGERRRALATFGGERERFVRDFEGAVAPLLMRYVKVVRELSAVFQELDAALPPLRERAITLRGEGEALGAFKGAPPHDLITNAHTWQFCGVAVDRARVNLHPFLHNARLAVSGLYESLPPTERGAIDAATEVQA